MEDPERALKVVTELRDMGLGISIDDFGTGYSSLAYLRELPVDELKIDRSFVTNVDLDAHNEVIVRSTINLAHSLGLEVIAEGIEREAERAILASLGCDLAQGYLMSRPLPAEKFDRWRATQRQQVRGIGPDDRPARQLSPPVPVSGLASGFGARAR